MAWARVGIDIGVGPVGAGLYEVESACGEFLILMRIAQVTVLAKDSLSCPFACGL